MPLFPNASRSPQGLPEVTAQEVLAQQDKLSLVDVREPPEWTDDLGHASSATLVPLSTWPAGAAKIDRSKPVVVVCRSGGRSARAAALLMQSGVSEVYNLQGGMMAWVRAGLPVERT